MKIEIYNKQSEDVRRMFDHGLSVVSPEKTVRSAVRLENGILTISDRSYTLTEGRRIWVFGSGKAAGPMALELENILGKRIYDGIVICPYGLETSTHRIQQFGASHPVPDLNSLTATYELADVASDVRGEDLVIYLLSGGTSSLLCMPDEELEFDEVRELYRLLLTCGAPIDEMNRIRKSISQIKGGGLRRIIGRASVEVLAISDVPDDDPAVIGSGPLIPDPVTASEALELLRKYKLDKKTPRPVVRYLEAKSRKENPGKAAEGNSGESVAETPELATCFTVIASAKKLAHAIAQGALSLGYHSHTHEGFLTGEAREVARTLASHADDVLRHNKPVAKPAALIYYGETTVTVKGTGKGGRNQELALAAALALQDRHHITLLSAGTDGRDGETNAAGAIVNGSTCADAKKGGLNPETFLNNNDSWNFFHQTGGHLITGPTGNNLMDIQIALIDR